MTITNERLAELIASSESLCIIRQPGYNVFDIIAALRELRDLRAERDALRKDAERYRWLREVVAKKQETTFYAALAAQQEKP